MRTQSGATAAILAVAAAALVAGATATSTSHVVSGSTSRLPMGLSEVITDLEAEGAGNLATAAFLTSRSVCRSRRAVLFRSLFGVAGDGEEDHQVQDGSTTAFGKRMGGDDDEESTGAGVVVANACGRRSVAEVAATVQACGGTVVYAADVTDLDRGEGLFDALAPAVERYLASCADDGEGEMGSLGQAGRKSVLVVVLLEGSDSGKKEMAAARDKFEAAAAVMLSSIVQPEGKRCKALEEVFDRVEYVASTAAIPELLCATNGGAGCTDPATAASAVSSAVTDLERSGAAASCGLAKPVDLAAARRLGDASHGALKFVMSTVERATAAEDDGSASAAQLVPDFGALCDATVKRAMEDFDAQAGSLTKKSAVARRIRHDLLEEIYAELADLYDVQVRELRSATFVAFRKGLSQLRLGPNLPDEMNRVATESVAAFVSQAKKLRAHGRGGVALSWPASDAAASDFRRELKEFSTDRLNKARVEGKFRPAPRKGVSIGLHWLLPKPFGNDYRQDPWNVHAKDNLVYTPPDKITDVSKADVKTGDWRKSVVPNPTGSDMVYLQ